MKSNVKENIGYISIAVVLALTFVLSVVAIDTYHNNDIVANAQVEIEGETYNDILVENYQLLQTSTFVSYGTTSTTLSFQPLDGSIYFVELHFDVNSVFDTMFGFIHCNNGYSLFDFGSNHESKYVLGTGSLYPSTSEYYFSDYSFMPISITYDTDNEFYSLIYLDFDDFTHSSSVTLSIYLVPQEVQEDTSTTDSFLSLIGDGITFGFESIADGVTYTMNNLFIVDGELTNFSTIIFLMTGISLALAVLKFVLNFIFTFGGKS